MENIKNFKNWRAEEIVKVFLLKSEYQFSIEKYPTPLFDLFVALKKTPAVKFAIEVKTTTNFKVNLSEQLRNVKIYRDLNMITIPVLLFKIDEKNEKGEIDFLVIPSFKNGKLLVRNEFQFQEMNQDNFKSKIETIIKWQEKR